MAAVKTSTSERPVTTRRERARAATKAEILGAARKLLVEGGIERVTQRGIAAELELTAPALYRYFDSRELILIELIQELYDELGNALIEVRDAELALPARDRLRSTARAFRQWALDHRAEFALLFGAPIEGVERTLPTDAADMKFCALWLTLFVDLIRDNPEEVPADDEIDPELRVQLQPFVDFLQGQLPIGAAARFLTGWTQLYGAIAIEIFGHLKFAIQDGSLLFENLLDQLSAKTLN